LLHKYLKFSNRKKEDFFLFKILVWALKAHRCQIPSQCNVHKLVKENKLLSIFKDLRKKNKRMKNKEMGNKQRNETRIDLNCSVILLSHSFSFGP